MKIKIILFLLFCLSFLISNAFEIESREIFPHKNKSNFLLKSIKKEKEEMDLGIKGKFILSGGIGLNLFKANLYLCYVRSTFFTDSLGGLFSLKTQEGPMTNVMVDYGIAERISVGVAFGYQTYRATWTPDYYFANLSESFTDKWTRLHFAVRGDYHIIANENICLYTGVKIGYNTYKMTSSTFTQYDKNYIKNADVIPSPISVQAHFGFSYFFESVVGINAEIGIGYAGPYLFALGVTGKF